MIFFDTCIWIELVAARNPVTQKDIRQATMASALLENMELNHEKLITCREQILEILSAIQKYKMKEYNRNCDGRATQKVGNLKEFRASDGFYEAQELCCQACDDVRHMAELVDIEANIDNILRHIQLVDINDYMYYEYCNANGIDFYTFDEDFQKLESNGNIHVLTQNDCC